MMNRRSSLLRVGRSSDIYNRRSLTGAYQQSRPQGSWLELGNLEPPPAYAKHQDTHGVPVGGVLIGPSPSNSLAVTNATVPEQGCGEHLLLVSNRDGISGNGSNAILCFPGDPVGRQRSQVDCHKPHSHCNDYFLRNPTRGFCIALGEEFPRFGTHGALTKIA